ncbi:hypothetical protein ROE7235_03842 [Roseibaca ekhonensis]|uniref:Uncharacterized protein n=1 Tax=Roseinatronobacter ekhonensis TaxID=254356 RepID=A0A3B0MDX3_9RHOB|nr:hypothetical protein [Roseibaca ekhonensis]SUZ34061.1 hypothetical protein ROE7235_03842 [Roseibaca ekhonensis]
MEQVQQYRGNIGIFGILVLALMALGGVVLFLGGGVCQRSCPPLSSGVSDFRGADFGFGVEPDGSGGLPVAGFA